MFWCLSKPACLQNWVDELWNDPSPLSLSEMHEVYSACHPQHAGYHQVRFTNEDSSDYETTVEILWKLDESIPQYRIELIHGASRSDSPYSPLADDRACPVLQTKLLAPDLGVVSSNHSWPVLTADDFSSIVVQFSSTLPLELKCVDMVDADPVGLKSDMEEWGIGSVKPISQKLNNLLERHGSISLSECRLPNAIHVEGIQEEENNEVSKLISNTKT